ncbi:MAG TPA: metallophosphoesterase [Polyangiaceae bacterium]|nr:metallophosphoesterase [Polyangiaceae bacterium]
MFASKKPFVLTAVCAAALGGGVTSLVNCSSGDTPTGTPSSANVGNTGSGPTAASNAGAANSGAGTIGFSLSLPNGAQVSSVTYDLLNSAAAPVILSTLPNPGSVTVGNSASIDFQLGGVPAATGDSISLTASITGGGTCQGSASGINVTAGGTTNVIVQMLCSLPGTDAGNVFVTGTTSYCGTWTSLSTTSSEVYVGESLVLTATATGANPSNLGYTWTMSNPIGAFGSVTPDGGVGTPGQDEAVGPSDPEQFMCTAAGTTTITLVVDDGPNDAGTCPTNLSTLTTTVICDAYPSNQVESAWVELAGPNGGSNGFTGNVAIARAVTAYVPPADAGTTNPCPNITINGGTPVQMNLRAAATTSLAARSVNTLPNKPSLFPVSSCEYQLPSGVTSAVVAGQSLPLPKANPTKIVVIGDSGCRLQNGNGTQSCNDTNPNGTDTPYVFALIASLAAAQNPDLVLDVGDWDYRDNPCPPGLGFNCGGSPWGFGWDTWEADVFTPAAPLLAAAPWIMNRGNHEQCNRAGQGWYRFLDTSPFDTTDHHTCDNAADDTTATGGSYNNPFLVQINSATQVIAFDTSNAKPISGTATGTTSAWYTTYQSELTTAGELVSAAPLTFNIWSNHHPIFGYATATAPALPTSPIPLFPPVMNSVFPNTYFPPPINLALHGHTHDYQAINFAPGTLADGGTFQPAATLVSGNEGDLLDVALPYPLTGTALSAVGNPTAVSVATPDGGVQQFATADNGAPFQNPNSGTDNTWGYMVLQFNAGSPPATPPTWVATEYRWDNTVRDVCTVQPSGTMSCASWGIIPPDEAGAY